MPLTKGEVEIRQKMTIEELAQAMGKDIGESLVYCLRLNETQKLKFITPLSGVAEAKMPTTALVSGC